jgi:hypothetical protein
MLAESHPNGGESQFATSLLKHRFTIKVSEVCENMMKSFLPKKVNGIFR